MHESARTTYKATRTGRASQWLQRRSKNRIRNWLYSAGPSHVPLTTCLRCGASFEGMYCPLCGTPARSGASAETRFGGDVPCARCGTVYAGNFCPNCGWPRAAGIRLQPPPPTHAGLSALSVLWTIALVLFVVFALLDFAGLLIGPSFVVPGIQSIASGETVNANVTSGNADWTFQALSGGPASGSWSAGGGPGGPSDAHLSMTLGANQSGMWYQPFRISGSGPYGGSVSLDAVVQTAGSLHGELVVAVEGTATGLDLANAVAVLFDNGTAGRTTTPAFDVSAALPSPGLYYLKIAFLATGATSTVTVGIDNAYLHWATDEFVVFYLPLPLPTVLAYSQNPLLFLGWYVFLVVAILAAAAYYLLRERRVLAQAFGAPLADVSARLRSRGAWVAIAQVWMAVSFVQIAIILALEAVGVPATSPIGQPTAASAWGFLYELANASVYEEVVFRALLIGLPLALGSFVSRLAHANGSRRTDSQASSERRYLLGSLRYLAGGNLRRSSSRQALLGAWILLFASAVVFGVAHAPSWGSWKIVPAMVAGLAFGYLFLRHGIAAAVLGHFVNDYASALTYENVGGMTFQVIFSLLFLALIAAGAGFFVWYLRYAWENLRELASRYGAHVVRQPAATTQMPVTPPPTAVYGPPIVLPPPTSGATGAPPAVSAADRPPPAAGPPPSSARDMLGIPPGYVPTYHPPPYGFPPVRFQCPSCGWVEAKYSQGRFTCLRCGRTT